MDMMTIEGLNVEEKEEAMSLIMGQDLGDELHDHQAEGDDVLVVKNYD